MEFYWMPPECVPSVQPTREALRSLFRSQGLEITCESERPGSNGILFWKICLADPGTALDFQEKDGVLTFATHYHAMDAVSEQVEHALQAAGWQVDEESFG